MSKRQPMMNILDKAKGKEKKYDWLEAANLYGQALGAVGKKGFLKKGEIQERIGYCFRRAAFQAENNEEFKETIHQAVEAYEKARDFYEKLEDEQKTARMFRCEAITKYLDYWLTSVPSEKRALLDECLELEGKALTVFSEAGDMLEYGRTCNELPLVSWLRANLEWNRQTLKIILKDGIEWGEKAVATLSQLGDPCEIAKAQFVLATCLDMEYGYGAHFIEPPEEMENNRLRVVRLLDKSVDLFEKVGDAFFLGLSHWWWALNTGGEESVKHHEKTLEYGKQTRDNLLIAGGLDYLAYVKYWKAIATEDPGGRKKLAKEAVQLNDKAQHHYSVISFISPRGGVLAQIGGYAEYYWHLADWETDPKRTLEFLEKSEKAGMETLKLAEASGLPFVVYYVLHVLSKTLLSRGFREPEVARKRSFLEKALKYREKSIEIVDQLTPFDYFNNGVMQNYLGQIKSNLADIEPNFDRKKNLLKEAVTSMEKCLELCNKHALWYESMGDFAQFAALRGYQEFYATLLTHLHNLTNNPAHLRKAIEILEKAIESASKLDLVSLIAESYWKIARTQDILEEHLKAAENFKRASEGYLRAAEKIPQLEDFYQDHASYMEAWSEIETARHHHRRQEYGSAKEHFEKAADLHKSLRQWSYLAPNYSAWALVEHAEELSRKEQSEEALQTFEQAAQLFKETKKTLQTQRSKIESLDEKQMAINMLKATDLRHEYCTARIALEEAKILDKKGDHAASSEKYGSVAEAFEKISQALESERDLKEFKFLISLSRAWQKMTLAEAEASPALYVEASQHFKNAKESSPNEKAKMLMLGHSRFCKALEAGARFEETREPTLYSTAKKHMEAAENYYLKAGFKNASEYAKATYMLFDAYTYLNQAQTEMEPRKKAQYYQMAERILQSSVGSFTKARHPEKSEQVQRLLESVKEKRQLAMSLTEVLHAPTITSTTTSFSTPTPTQEQAVGLERFEHADIQANLILRVREVRVGEDVEFRVELVNAGKAPALLIKVDEILPEGFEIKEVPEVYAVEDSYINMKGRRLNPLKTEDVKMVIKPRSKGTFRIKPRILYIDENGKYKSHEPEPVTITVKELGIKGWIKGER